MAISHPHQRALDRSLVRGVAWTAIARWATQGVTWASLFIVARLLSPADYGLVAMASIVLNFAQLLAEFGIEGFPAPPGK